MVPRAGFEPARVISPEDFKSPTSAIPSPRRSGDPPMDGIHQQELLYLIFFAYARVKILVN